MAQRYQNIMVAIDGSKEADLAFVKGVHSALRNDAKLTIAHVIDTRALQRYPPLMLKFTKNSKSTLKV